MKTRIACLALCLAAAPSFSSAQTTSTQGSASVPGRISTPVGGVVPDVIPSGFIDLAGQPNCGASPRPWGGTFSPDGRHLYVSLFGGFIGNGGCRVLHLDGQTGAVLNSIEVGESPEDIALRVTPQGAILQGFVTCSSSSDVVVFNALDQPIATIPLPPFPGGPYPTAFPFGIVIDEARNTVWVGSNDSSGRVFAIDIPTLTLDTSRTLQLGDERGVSRFALYQGELVIPTFRFTPGFGGSIAELAFVDPDGVQPIEILPLASADQTGAYPAPQDIVISPDGRAFVAGFDMGARVFVAHIPTRTPLSTIPTMTSQSLGKFQCMALSPDGLLVVADFWTAEMSRINSFDGTHLGTTDSGDLVGFHDGPTAALFRPDGTELLIVETSSNSVARLAVQ